MIKLYPVFFQIKISITPTIAYSDFIKLKAPVSISFLKKPTTDADGIAIGIKTNKYTILGNFSSKIANAKAKDKTIMRGMAIPINVPVFFRAIWKARFDNRDI